RAVADRGRELPQVGEDALVDGAALEIELAGRVDLHGAVGGADLVGERVGVEQQLGGGVDLDGAVVGEIAEREVGDRAVADRGRELSQVGEDALVDGAALEIELAGRVDLHGAVGGADLVGERVGVEQQLGGGVDLDGAVVRSIDEGVPIYRAVADRGRELP